MTEFDRWGDFALGVGETEMLRFGQLGLALRRTPTELQLQRSHEADFAAPTDEGWERWALPAETKLSMTPAVPDRLLVVSHASPFNLPPGGEAKVYVRIPIFLQIRMSAGRTSNLTLADVPSVILSDTWWGSFVSGEVAYWLTTKARAEVQDDLFVPHLAMCPIRVVNNAETALPFERFALRVTHLSLFRSGGRNWTDTVRVDFYDAPEGSSIDFSGQPPAEAPSAERLAQPRVPPKKGFHARTFDRLRSLSGRWSSE